VKRCEVWGADAEKQQDLDSLRKAQLKIERSYDRTLLRATTGLGTEQLLFNIPTLITPRTCAKERRTNFYKILAA
jgi:hypothetical protein